jgi:rhamnosyltransferase
MYAGMFQQFTSELVITLVIYKEEVNNVLVRMKLIDRTDLLIFIYDNSPTAQVVQAQHIAYVHDGANSGVSKAYNKACGYAISKGAKWMLLLDQDTEFYPHALANYFFAVVQHQDCKSFVPRIKDKSGYLSPFKWRLAGGVRLQEVQSKYDLVNYRFINSGLLIQTDTFKKAAGYSEEIKLDFSDIAFGQRLMNVTDHFCLVDLDLLHSFSSNEHDASQSAERFKFYCEGASALGKSTGNRLTYTIRALSRSLKLSVKFRRGTFLKIFYNQFLAA